MDNIETLRLLRMAHDEVVQLRREIERLSPKAHAYDTLAQMARLTVQQVPQGYGEDVAWLLKKACEGLVNERTERQDDGQ